FGLKDSALKNRLGRVGLKLRLEGLIRKNSELYKLEIPSAGGGPVGCGGFGAAEPQVPDRGTRPLLSEHEFAARGAANRASSAAALSGAGGEGSPKGRLRLAAAHRPTAGLKNSDKHFPQAPKPATASRTQTCTHQTCNPSTTQRRDFLGYDSLLSRKPHTRDTRISYTCLTTKNKPRIIRNSLPVGCPSG